MNFTIEKDSGRDIYVITVSGEVRRPEDSISLQKLASDIRSEDGCNRFLFDMRSANIKGGEIETFKVGVAPEKSGLERDFAIALLYSRNLDNQKFLEDVLVNRGYRVRVFNNMHVALGWLAPDYTPDYTPE